MLLLRWINGCLFISTATPPTTARQEHSFGQKRMRPFLSLVTSSLIFPWFSFSKRGLMKKKKAHTQISQSLNKWTVVAVHAQPHWEKKKEQHKQLYAQQQIKGNMSFLPSPLLNFAVSMPPPLLIAKGKACNYGFLSLTQAHTHTHTHTTIYDKAWIVLREKKKKTEQRGPLMSQCWYQHVTQLLSTKRKKKINENGKPVNELADDTQRRLGRIQTKVGEEPIVYYWL